MSAMQSQVYQTSSTVGTITLPLVSGQTPVIEWITASTPNAPATSVALQVYAQYMKGDGSNNYNLFAPAAAATSGSISVNYGPSGLKLHNGSSACTLNVRCLNSSGTALTLAAGTPATLAVGYRMEPA